MMAQPAQVCIELAKRITAIRLQKTWTRETLAKQSQVNIFSLKRFERTGQISLERLIALCQALDIHYEIEKLFKPRQRVDVDQWELINSPARKRGKRNTVKI